MIDSDPAPIVVRESKVQRDGLFGFLTLAFAAAAVRGVLGAATSGGRIAAGAVFGVLVVGTAAAWLMVRRQDGRLVVSTDRIALVRGAAKETGALPRTADARLAFVVKGAARYRHTALVGSGDAEGLNIQLFSRQRVRDACVAKGWRLD